MLKLKVITIGEEEGLILNEEAKRILNVKAGDTLYIAEAQDGAMRITPYNPEFERQMNAAEAIQRDDCKILRALAK